MRINHVCNSHLVVASHGSQKTASAPTVVELLNRSPSPLSLAYTLPVQEGTGDEKG